MKQVEFLKGGGHEAYPYEAPTLDVAMLVVEQGFVSSFIEGENGPQNEEWGEEELW